MNDGWTTVLLGVADETVTQTSASHSSLQGIKTSRDKSRQRPKDPSKLLD